MGCDDQKVLFQKDRYCAWCVDNGALCDACEKKFNENHECQGDCND